MCDIKEVEEKLMNYRKMKIALERLKYDLEELTLDPMLGKPHELSAVSFDSDTVQGGRSVYGFHESIKAAIDKFIARADLLNDRIDKLFAAMMEIENLIECAPLDDMEYSYISHRYLQGYKVNQTAEELDRTERMALHYKKSALNKLKDIL